MSPGRGHAGAGAVVLDPHFAVADVNVDDGAVDAVLAVPAHLHHLVVIAFVIHDGFRPDVAARRLVGGVLLDQSAHDHAISVQLIHRTTFCCWGSKTRTRKRTSATTN
jgi:hypothetical protein